MRQTKLNPASLSAPVVLSAVVFALLSGATARAEPGTANGIIMNAELATAVPTLGILKTLQLSPPTVHFAAEFLGQPLLITGWENLQDGQTHTLADVDPRRVRCDLSLSSYGKHVESFELIRGWASFGSSVSAPDGQVHYKLGVPSLVYTGTFPLDDGIDPKTGAVDPATAHPSGASYVTFQCYKPFSSGGTLSVGEIREAIGLKNFDFDMVSPFVEPQPYVQPLNAPQLATKPRAPAPAATPAVILPPVLPPTAPPIVPPVAPPAPPVVILPTIPTVIPPVAPQTPPPPTAPTAPRVPRYNPPPVPTGFPRGPNYNPPGGGRGTRPPRMLPPGRVPR